MAYRKTEGILAAESARKSALIAAAIDIINKEGSDAIARLTVTAPEKAKVSAGLLYNYWADKTEFLAAITKHVMDRDLALLREYGALSGHLQDGIRAWARQCAAAPRSASFFGTEPAYRNGMKAELVKQLRAKGVENSALLSAVIYGAVIEAAQVLTPRTERDLVAVLFRAMGQRVPA